MGRWSSLVLMAVEAVDGSGKVVVDDVLYSRAHRSLGVDVPGGVMAGRADVQMAGQDIIPILHRMAIGAGLGINLAQVGRTYRYLMVNRTADGAMVVASAYGAKVGGMAVDTLAGTVKG